MRKDFERPDCHYNIAQSKRPNVFISVGNSLLICDILASWIPLLWPGPDCPHPFSVDQLTESSLSPGLSDVFMTNETASLGLYSLFFHWLPPWHILHFLFFCFLSFSQFLPLGLLYASLTFLCSLSLLYSYILIPVCLCSCFPAFALPTPSSETPHPTPTFWSSCNIVSFPPCVCTAMFLFSVLSSSRLSYPIFSVAPPSASLPADL